jgi:hypothetical protein
MAIIISTTGEHRHDQSAGVQSGGGLDKDDVALDADLGQLPDPFENFLELALGTAISAGQLGFAANVEAALEDPGAGFFVNVATTAGETVNDLFFSKSDGTLFNGEVAQFNGSDLHVVGSSDQIFLYSFAGGDILILSTEAPAGVDITDPSTLDGTKIVAAYYLEENGTHTGADVWGVWFKPIDHPDDTNADDIIDFGDFLHVSASATLSFELDALRSGNFLWAAIGSDDAGLLITGRDLNVFPADAHPASKQGKVDTAGAEGSDQVNTSQGGLGATTGINNQMYVAGNTGVFTLVTDFDPLAASTTGEAAGVYVQEIDYDGYINTVGAGIFISQTQGGGSVNLTISVFEADANLATAALEPETGFAYIGAENGNDGTSGSFENDTPVGVHMVEVIGADGVTVIGTWVDGEASDGTTQGGVTVTIDGNDIIVTGLQVLYTVHWTADSGETFNRFHVTADTGTTAFDIGRVDVDQGVLVTQAVGEDVIEHDDGLSGDAGAPIPIEEEEEAAVQGDGNEDNTSGPPDLDLDTVGPDDFDNTTNTNTSELITQIAGGTDAGIVFSLDGSDLTNDLPAFTSKGATVLYDLAFDDNSTPLILTDDVYTLTAYVDVAGGTVGDLDAGDRQVFTWVVEGDGTAIFTQLDQLDHAAPPAGTAVENTLTFNPTSILDAADGDGDPVLLPAGFVEYTLIDDIPIQNANTANGVVEEEELAGGNEDLLPDPTDADNGGNNTTNVAVLNLAGLIDVGTDEDPSFALVTDAAADAWLAGLNLTSQGSALNNAVIVGNTLTAKSADGRDIFTLALSGANLVTATFTLLDQLDHAAPVAPDTSVENTLVVDLSGFVEGRDFDLDAITLDAGSLTATVIDDTPIFTANVAGGPATGLDFIDGSTFTSSLNGSVGTDANDASNEASDGTKTYTFTDFGILSTSIAGLQGAIIENDTRIVFFTDGDSAGNVAGVFDGNDTLWFDYTINQTANAGAGSYTFAVHENAPDQFLEFDFDGFPSGKQAYGVFGPGTNGTPDPDGPAILVFAQGTNLVNSGSAAKIGTPVVGSSAGNLVNSSNAESSGTALAVNNQSTSPGQGLFVAYIDDPELDNIVVGVGTSGELNGFYDDAEFLHFNQALTEVTSASAEISQITPNGHRVDIEITAYNVTLSSSINTETEAIDFLENPLATTANQSAAQVNIDSVTVFDASGDVIEYWQDLDHNGTYELADSPDDADTLVDNDATVNVTFSPAGPGIHKATVFNAADNYTIAWTTETVHDLALVKNVDTTGDNFDLGGFNLAQGQDTPDQKFSATVQITDFDLDSQESNTFENFVDGTGNFDDDVFDLTP